MNRLWKLLLLGIIILGTANVASADIIHDQLGATGSGQWEFSVTNASGKHFVAQDFPVYDSCILNKLTFRAHTTATTDPVTDVWVNIYADDGTLVGLSSGSLLSSQHKTGSYTGTYAGTWGLYTLRDYSVRLSPVTLNPGTYWLALHIDPYQGNDMHWTIAKDGTYPDSRVRWSWNDGNNWDGWYYEHSFRLEGSPVPVPGALWLLGSGLVAVAGLRRRKSA